jgi:hypothetical protein
MTYFIESPGRSWTVSLSVNYHEGKLKLPKKWARILVQNQEVIELQLI